jgi:hypothetical protein
MTGIRATVENRLNDPCGVGVRRRAKWRFALAARSEVYARPERRRGSVFTDRVRLNIYRRNLRTLHAKAARATLGLSEWGHAP